MTAHLYKTGVHRSGKEQESKQTRLQAIAAKINCSAQTDLRAAPGDLLRRFLKIENDYELLYDSFLLNRDFLCYTKAD